MSFFGHLNFILFLNFDMWSHCVILVILELGRPGWSQSHRDSAASASLVLALKVCTRPPYTQQYLNPLLL